VTPQLSQITDVKTDYQAGRPTAVLNTSVVADLRTWICSWWRVFLSVGSTLEGSIYRSIFKI